MAERTRRRSIDWRFGHVRVDGPATLAWIEGYCSKQSVRGGRGDRNLRLHQPGSTVPPPKSSGWAITAAGGEAGQDDRVGWRTAQPTPARGQELARRPMEIQHPNQNPRRLVERRLPRALTAIPEGKGSVRFGKAMSCSSCGTTAPPISSFSVQTTPSRRTTAGPATARSYTHPKGVQGPWADVSFVTLMAAKPSTRVVGT